jgi:hypothetical protein
MKISANSIFSKTSAAILVFLFLSMPLWSAPQTTGEIRVKEARGNPAQIVMPDGSTPPVRVHDVIPEGALVKTPRDSFLSLLFANGAVLAIKPASEILISRFTTAGVVDFKNLNVGHAATETSQSSTRLDLKSGLILLDIPRLAPKSQFQISTPVGIGGIRGTQLYVLAKKNRGAIGVASGRVLATSLLGETQNLGPGQAIGLTATGLVPPTSGEMNLIRKIDATFGVPLPNPAPEPAPIPSQKAVPQSRATYKTSE